MIKTQLKLMTEDIAYSSNHCQAPCPGIGCSAMHVPYSWCGRPFSFSTTGKKPISNSLSDVPESMFSKKMMFSDIPESMFSKKMMFSDIPENVFSKKMMFSDIPENVFSEKMKLSDVPENMFSEKMKLSDVPENVFTGFYRLRLPKENQYQDAAKQILTLLTK